MPKNNKLFQNIIKQHVKEDFEEFMEIIESSNFYKEAHHTLGFTPENRTIWDNEIYLILPQIITNKNFKPKGLNIIHTDSDNQRENLNLAQKKALNNEYSLVYRDDGVFFLIRKGFRGGVTTTEITEHNMPELYENIKSDISNNQTLEEDKYLNLIPPNYSNIQGEGITPQERYVPFSWLRSPFNKFCKKHSDDQGLPQIMEALDVASEVKGGVITKDRKIEFSGDTEEYAQMCANRYHDKLVFLKSGFLGHSTTIVILGDYIAICDRSTATKTRKPRAGRQREHAIEIRKIKKKPLTKDDFAKLIKGGRNVNEYRDILDNIASEKVLLIDGKMQTYGSCSYTNAKKSVQAAMILVKAKNKNLALENCSTNNEVACTLDKNLSKDLQEICDDSKKTYKSFTGFCRENFIIEELLPIINNKKDYSEARYKQACSFLANFLLSHQDRITDNLSTQIRTLTRDSVNMVRDIFKKEQPKSNDRISITRHLKQHRPELSKFFAKSYIESFNKYANTAISKVNTMFPLFNYSSQDTNDSKQTEENGKNTKQKPDS